MAKSSRDRAPVLLIRGVYQADGLVYTEHRRPLWQVAESHDCSVACIGEASEKRDCPGRKRLYNGDGKPHALAKSADLVTFRLYVSA